MRWLAFVGLVLALLPAGVGAQAACRFENGFATLAGLLPYAVGQCTTGEHVEAEYPGWVVQRSTTGMMFWRESDGWTGFTDGNWNWRLEANGTVSRALARPPESPPAPVPTPKPALPPCWLVAQTWVPQSQIDQYNALMEQIRTGKTGPLPPIKAEPMPPCDPSSPPPQRAAQSYRPNANLTRVAQDLYKDTYTGGYLRTMYCYEYVYYQDAIVFSNKVIFTSGGSCDLR